MLRTVGLMLGAAIIGGVIGGLAVFALDNRGSDSAGQAAQGDIVVNVVRKCEIPNANAGVLELFDSHCHSSSTNTDYPTTHLAVTVRTSAGTTYTVDAPTTTVVTAGDPWPKP